MNTIRRDGLVIRLEPKVMEVCALLADRAGKVVRKEELIRAVWADTFVTDDVLTHAISELRKALEDDAKQPKFIETIPRRGYRLIVSVRHEQPGVSNCDSPAAPGKPQPETAMLAARHRRNGALVLAAGISAAIGLVATVSWRLPHPSPAAARPVEKELSLVPIVTYGDGGQWLPAFSPDGTRVAYSWNVGDEFDFSWYLEVKVLGSDTRLRLTKQPAAFPPGPAWSPDGREIAFVRASALDDRGIYVISAMGGPERKLRPLAPWHYTVRVVSWSPDGRWIAFADEAGPTSDAKREGRGPNALFLISPETLETRQLTNPAADELGDSAPTFSPDGKTIAFIHSTAGSQDEVWTIPVKGGQAHRLFGNGGYVTGLCWTHDSESVIFDLGGHDNGFALWRVHSTGVEPRPLDLETDGSTLREPTLWHDRLAFEAWKSAGTVGRVRLDNRFADLPQTPVVSTRWDHGGHYSPRGDRIAFLSDRTGTDELWVADADGTNPRQLTHLGIYLLDLSWAPDGSSVAVGTEHGKIYLVSVETGSPRLIFSEDTYLGEGNVVAFSRDGRFVYVMSQPGKRHELLKVPIYGGAPVKVLDGFYTKVAESPDGQTLFFSRPVASKVPGAPGIWKRAVEGGPEEYVVKDFSGIWDLGPDGLYLLNHGNSALEKYSFAGKRLQTVARLGQFHGAIAYPLSISPDGRWAMFSYRQRNVVDIEMVPGFK